MGDSFDTGFGIVYNGESFDYTFGKIVAEKGRWRDDGVGEYCELFSSLVVEW